MKNKGIKFKSIYSLLTFFIMLVVIGICNTACQNTSNENGKKEAVENKEEKSERQRTTNKNTESIEEELKEDVTITSKKEENGSYKIDNIDSEKTGKIYSQTVMIYMVGSDLETNGANASYDIVEMMESKVDTAVSNILIYTGGAEIWWIDETLNRKNTTLILTEDNVGVVESEDAKSMGDAQCLSNFINFVLDNCRTDKYSLILWDHGGGPVLGYGMDEVFQDVLDLSELKHALDDSVSARNIKLEWIGFDACIMSSLEIASVLADYSNYMIASQETEPGWGWDYSFLSALSQSDMDGEHLSAEIIDSFYEYSENCFKEEPKCYSDITLSCIDLSKVSDLEIELNDFFAGQDRELNEKTFATAAKKHSKIREFATFSTKGGYGVYDLLDFINALDKDEAEKVVQMVDETIVYMRSNVKRANGISICFPCYSEKEYAEACIAIDEQLGFAPNYTKYIKEYLNIKNGGTFLDKWDLKNAKSDVIEKTDENKIQSDISIQLTKEQQENFAYAEFAILVNQGAMEDGRIAYSRRYLGKNTELDENGILHAYFGNEVVYMAEIGGTEEYFMPLIEDNSSDKEKRYIIHAGLWYKDSPFLEMRTVKLQIVVNDEYPNGIIRSAVDMEENSMMPGKELIDINDYAGIMIVESSIRYETRDELGNMLPFEIWEDSSILTGVDLSIEKGLELRIHQIDNLDDYMCMFYIYDTQGNCMVTEMISLGQ